MEGGGRGGVSSVPKKKIRRHMKNSRPDTPLLSMMVEYGRALEWLQLREDLQKAEFPMLSFQAGDV